MNLLASLNLIMQVVLSVLVLWRIALIIAGLFVVLATVLCVASLIVGGEACGLEEPAVQLADKMRKLDKPISETVMRILGAMRVAQFAVSEATPALAWGFSGSDTQGAYPALTSASTWSASVLPSLNTQAIQDVKSCFFGKKDPTEKADPTKWDKFKAGYTKTLGVYDDYLGTPRLSMPLSLPISAGEYSALCGKAGELVVQGLGKVLELVGAGLPSGALDKASSIIGKVTSSAPSVFCMPMSGTSPLKDAMGDLEDQAVQKCNDDLSKDPNALITDSDPKDPRYHTYGTKHGEAVTKSDWLKDCKKDKMKKADDELKEAVEKDTESAEACGKPAEVWGFASNGNVFMRSFSSVEQAETTSSHDDKGIDVGDGSRTGNVTAVQTGSIGAHAEMYFNCEEGWSECKEKAMWELKWEARLRRVQPFHVLASTAVEQIAVTTLMKLANKGATDFMNSLVHDHLNVRADRLPNVGDLFVWGWVKGKATGAIYGHLDGSPIDGVREKILNSGSRNSVVH
jgi:hypothetical protein